MKPLTKIRGAFYIYSLEGPVREAFDAVENRDLEDVDFYEAVGERLEEAANSIQLAVEKELDL